MESKNAQSCWWHWRTQAQADLQQKYNAGERRQLQGKTNKKNSLASSGRLV
jgi:hypothetical protein